MPISWLLWAINLSKNGYYAHTKKKGGDEEILTGITEILSSELSFYGYRRVATELSNRTKKKHNGKKVLRIMQENNLIQRKKKKYKPKTTDSRHRYDIFPNRIAGLTITKPNVVWAADITYVRLQKGFCYVAIIIDVYTKKIRGWGISLSMDRSLVLDGLRIALRDSPPPQYHHSDRGGQYCSDEYIAELRRHNIEISMAAKGISVDNPFVESFNRTLKVEEVYLNEYESFADAKKAITHFILDVYNKKRLHSAIGYRSPETFENQIKNKKVEKGAYPVTIKVLDVQKEKATF